jgi:hypothetical protein
MNNTKSGAPTFIAVVFLIGFAVYVVYLARMTDLEDKIWTRHTYLLGGIEAVAFAGAGFLFGREVHRGQAENAEKRADEAQKEANKGKALAAAVKARASSRSFAGTGSGTPARHGPEAPDDAQRSLAELAAMADELLH